MKAPNVDKPKRKEWPKQEKTGNVTVKYYRRLRANGSFGYEVADYSTGARVLRSFPTEEGAKKKAKEIADKLAAGEVTAAAMRNADAASYGRAIELLRETGVCLEIAAAHFAEAFKILGADKIVAAAQFYKDHNPDNLTPKTVSEVVDELLAHKAKKETNTTDDLRTRCRKFAESFKVQINTITTVDVQKWLDGLKVSERTRLNYRTKVGQLFRFAERRGYIIKNSNPVLGTEKPDVPEGKIEIYTPEEIERLILAASPEFRPCVLIGAFAGLRASEIQRLKWEQVDLKRGQIEASGKKRNTPSRRFVPICDNLKKWLAPYADRRGLVWQPKIANRRLAEDYFSGAQGATSAATADPKNNLDPIAWKHNGLRHSWISYRMAELQNANQVALEAGNSSAMVFKHYRELVQPEAAKAWFAVAPETPENVIAMKGARQ